MPPRWLIHMNDGNTLTDADCFPHEENVMASLGYRPEHITSIERLIKGKHLTIKKSPFIDTFFVATEEGIDMKMLPGRQAPPVVTKRMIGCYVRDTDPPLQVRLTMDPRTYDTDLRFMRVKKKTLVGINAKPVIRHKRGELGIEFTRDIVGNRYSIIQSPDIDGCFTSPNGLSCHLKNPAIRAELVVMSQNVLLGFTQKGQKLRVEKL